MNSPLSPEQRARLESDLRERSAQLQAQRERHLGPASRAEHAREVLQQDADDARQRDADREVDFAVADREAVELAAIDAALARLAAGRYGRCGNCGEDIPLARLQLEPQALRCIACETERERGQPRPAKL